MNKPLPFAKTPENVATCIAFLDKLREIYKENSDIDAINESFASLSSDEEPAIPTVCGYRTGNSVGLLTSPEGIALTEAIINGVKNDISHDLTTINDVIALKRIINKTYLGKGEVIEFFDKVSNKANTFVNELINGLPIAFQPQKSTLKPIFKTERKRIKYKALERNDLVAQAEPIIKHILLECSKPSMTQPEISQKDIQRLHSYRTKMPFFFPFIQF